MIYLDSAATSYPKPEPVLEAVREALTWGNPGRASHAPAVRANARVREVREALASFLGVGEPRRIVFTMNATDGLSMAIKGVLRDGGHAVASAEEHNAVLRPLKGLRRDGRIALDVVPVGADGRVDPRAVATAVRPGETRLVVLNHVSNVLGTVQPVEEIARAVRERDPETLLLVDGAQSAGLIDVSPERIGADMLALTGHKALYGPQGIGALYVGPRAEGRLAPWREGGTGDGGDFQPEDLPRRMEAGTPNVPGISGLGAGVGWVVERGGPEAMMRHERLLARRLREGLSSLGGVRLFGPETPEAGIVPCLLDGTPPGEAAEMLASRHGIACRGGLQCAPDLHRALGTHPDGVLRFSLGSMTTPEDVDRTLEAVSVLLC